MLKYNSFNEISELISKIRNEISGQFSITEVLSPEFIDRNTKYETINMLLKKNGYNLEKMEFDRIMKNKEKIDRVIRKSSSFDSWDEMMHKATQDYIFKLAKKKGINIE